MVYLAASELINVLPANISIGTDTTPLTYGEVGSIIGGISAEIDAHAAAAGYSVPITDSATTALALVQQIAKDGAGARVLRILFFGTGAAPLTTAEEWEEAYKAALKAMDDGDLVLPGAPEDTTETTRLLARSFSTESSADSLETGASAYISRVWEP